ncbi:MAG: response regulator [candidate division NC10 bacterium]|nr:response regulator [candidate division NC10 bacterium]
MTESREEGPGGATPAGEARGARRRARVLVVEDDPASRELVAALLEEAGCQVLTAEAADIGLALATAERPDLILMDVQLPGLTGYAATRTLKAGPATAAIPVVALTARAMLGSESEARDAGCDAFLAKPFDVEVFRDTLRRFLPGGLRGPEPPGGR